MFNHLTKTYWSLGVIVFPHLIFVSLMYSFFKFSMYQNLWMLYKVHYNKVIQRKSVYYILFDFYAMFNPNMAYKIIIQGWVKYSDRNNRSQTDPRIRVPNPIKHGINNRKGTKLLYPKYGYRIRSEPRTEWVSEDIWNVHIYLQILFIIICIIILII